MKKEGFVSVISALFVIVSLLQTAGADVNTSLNVQGSRPFFTGIIPNQSWASDINLTDVFNLNDYFSDPNGYAPSYSFSQPANISILINSGGNVSFIPDPGYFGFGNTIFTASDSYGNTSSNIVYLNVTFDTSPPQWSSPFKTPSIIYQNTFVNFSTYWTENVQLNGFTFSINQGTGWQNYSGLFRGRINSSRYTVEISAAENKTVFWSFCASDTRTNQNCTTIQNFTVSPQPTSGQNVTQNQNYSFNQSYQQLPQPGTQQIFNFTVSPDFFKISLKQGGTDTRLLQISNIGTEKLVFNLSLDSISELVTLSDSQFSLDIGQSKSVTVDFTSTNYTSVGQYFGNILVKGGSSAKRVPVIIDVNPLYLNFKIGVNISDEWKRISPGHQVKANITIENLRDPPESNITLYYAIKDLTGVVYNFSEENMTLGNLIKIQRGLMMPSGVGPGTYIFYARASSGSFTTIDSNTFEIGTGFDFAAFFKYSSVVIAIFILSAFSMILFLKYKRTRTKERLLNLYLMLTELKKLIKDNQTDKAVDLFVRIKSFYGEHVSKTVLQNRDKLKEEINVLATRLQNEVGAAPAEVKGAAADASSAEKKDGETEAKPDQTPAAQASTPIPTAESAAPAATPKPKSKKKKSSPKKSSRKSKNSGKKRKNK